MITIIDYGMGNVGSIANMLRKVGTNSVITSNPDEIRQSTKIILPGVGIIRCRYVKSIGYWNYPGS